MGNDISVLVELASILKTMKGDLYRDLHGLLDGTGTSFCLATAVAWRTLPGETEESLGLLVRIGGNFSMDSLARLPDSYKGYRIGYEFSREAAIF